MWLSMFCTPAAEKKICVSTAVIPITSSYSSLVSPSQFLSHQSFTLKVQIKHSSVHSMLIDSRVAGNFMDHNTVMKLNITMQPLQHPLKICAIDGGPIEDRPAILCIKHLLLHVRTLHQEHISFHITITVKHPLILGFPWMHLHDPQIL